VEFRAAILPAPGAPLSVETVTSGELAPDDVRVKIRASSICHTDLEVIEGELKYPMPMILGHEVAGVVDAVGGNVTHVAPGDPVALHWNPSCNICYHCERDQPILCEPYARNRSKGAHFDGRHPLSRNGEPVNVLMYVGGFAEYAIVASQGAVRIPDGIPFDRACLLGCGVITGFGGAVNVARVSWDDSVVVFGCGAVGLAAIQGARIAGARRIIAVDPNTEKLAVAEKVGATDAINPDDEDALAAIRSRTANRGGDVVIEAAGNEAVFPLSVQAVRAGGRLVWLGKVNVDKTIPFRWGTLMGEREMVRSSYGGARPHKDFPLLAQAYLDGQLDLDSMITGRISLDQINEGIDLLRGGQAIRTVIDFPG
jgi:S-(hydroxymethyl)glutathione dehydrogenase/alcohol dehydrogenase